MSKESWHVFTQRNHITIEYNVYSESEAELFYDEHAHPCYGWSYYEGGKQCHFDDDNGNHGWTYVEHSPSTCTKKSFIF